MFASLKESQENKGIISDAISTHSEINVSQIIRIKQTLRLLWVFKVNIISQRRATYIKRSNDQRFFPNLFSAVSILYFTDKFLATEVARQKLHVTAKITSWFSRFYPRIHSLSCDLCTKEIYGTLHKYALHKYFRILLRSHSGKSIVRVKLLPCCDH